MRNIMMPKESVQSDQTLVDQVLSLTQVKRPEENDNKFSIGKILMDKLGFNNNHLVS